VAFRLSREVEERSDNMGIASMILGIIALVILLVLRAQIFMPGILKLAICSSVSIVGLVLGIIALVKSESNKPMAIAGVVICSLIIIGAILFWIVAFG
jgi:hypothetical protein